ncbi:MAG: hypothetical protein AAF543_13160 [Pseudomonadota bacterium]
MSSFDRKRVRNGTIGLDDQPRAAFVRDDDVSTFDDASFQRLITSAILAATAFRLRDHDGLTEALRMLVDAVKPFEVDPAGGEAI